MIATFQVHPDVLLLGIVTGMTYGVLGAGLVLIYRANRIINFAYGEIGALGAAILGTAVTKWHFPYWIAFIVALAAAALVGVACEVVVVRRFRSAPLVLTAIVTLGLATILDSFSAIVSSSVGAGITYPQPSGFPQFFVGALLMTPAYSAMLILTPPFVIAIAIFLRRGRLGIAMRAAAANHDAALMSGMRAPRLSSLAWALGGVMSAFTAILVLPTRGFSGGQFLGPGLLLRGLFCGVIGGMTSLPITLVAGLALGVIEQILLINYPSGGQVDGIILLIIVVALLLQRARSGRSEDKGVWATVQAFSPLPAAYRKVRSIRALPWVVFAICLAAAILIPELTTDANALDFTTIAVYSVVAMSVVIITGLGGQLSLGQFALAGLGAAVCWQVQSHGAPYLVGIAAAIAASVVVSLVIGLPAVRIKGLMLAVVTLGFSLFAFEWLLEQTWMLGRGVNPPGVAVGHFQFDTGKRFYWISLTAVVITFWFARNIWVGGVGRTIRAVRDNEDAARAFTVRATWVKLQAFALGGALAGLGGAIYVHVLSTVSQNAFPDNASVTTAAAAVIGGLGILAGPILGAMYLIGLPHWLPLDNAETLATGVGWVFLLVQLPGGVGQGLAPIRDRMVDALAARAGLDPVAERSITPGGGVDAAVGLAVTARSGVHAHREGESILVAKDLTKRFGGLTAVDDVNLEVYSGEILGLIGPNGAGKTTLFEVLGGFTRQDRGTVQFEGKDISRTRPEERARNGLIRSFQDAALFPTMTVHESVMLAMEGVDRTRVIPAVLGMGGRRDRRKAAQADELLATMGLTTYRDTRILALSTGTRRITEIACLIAIQPTLLLLDEPTSGIAQRETEALGEVIRNVRRQMGLTLVVIEHDIPLIMGLAERIVAMEAGRVIAVGTPAEIQRDPRVIAAYLGTDTSAIERSARGTAPAMGAVLAGEAELRSDG
jgi:ABC-type branched-subunit amino acid transport system ATPase component/branched-subunit amino acid ABC-type transport system permease component